MYEKNHQPLLSNRAFMMRVIRNLTISSIIVALSLGFGMWGYHHFESMSWIDSYENAAMILSGMGPVDPVKTNEGKIFAGSYALFSGIIFLVVIAITIVPLMHRFFHRFFHGFLIKETK